MRDLKAFAKECGFTVAEDLDPKTLNFMPEVREMCANGCRNYNRSWACPPANGSLEEWREKASRFSKGILMQTVGDIEDTLDFEAIMDIAKTNTENFIRFTDAILDEDHLDCLPLAVGGCSRCKKCTYPDAPCRFPDRNFSSMEATGLLVNQVCTDNGVPYNYGKGKMAYTSCLLYNE